MSYCKVIILGNLTRDVELRYTPKGTAVCKLTVAVNRTWKNEAGEKQEEVSFIDCDSFGRQAEVLSQYFKKGSQIMLDGRLKLDQWEDKTTHAKRSVLKVVVESFSFVGSAEKRQAAPAPAPAPEPEAKPAADTDDEKIPF